MNQDSKQKVIDVLNKGIGMEFTAARQYMYNATMLRDWGLDKLAEFESKELHEELEHVQKFSDRVLFLGGSPDFQQLGTIKKVATVEEVIKTNLEMEKAAIEQYRTFIKLCTDVTDFSTRALFLDIMKDEEGHLEHLEKQLSLIKLLGMQNYLLSVSK